MTRKAHPADPQPTAERNKPRPSESRKRTPRRVRVPRPEPEKYPNLEANAALERALHIHRAMMAGLTRKEAERHADEHIGPRGQLPVTERKRVSKVLSAAGNAPTVRSVGGAAPTPRRRPVKGARQPGA